MPKINRELSRQIIVRIDNELYEALENDAQRNERTVSQTVRYALRQLLPA